MKYLFAGHMSDPEFDQLISMSGLRSEGMIKSLKLHLVNGWDERLAISGNGVTQSNFSRDLKKLEKLFASIVKYNEIIGVTRISKVI
jgi:hypothetical protein